VAQTTLTHDEIEKLREELIDRITAIYRSVHIDVRDRLERFYGAEAEPRDEGDESSEVQLDDVSKRMDEREAGLAQVMEAALDRIRRGTFGFCQDCGQPIERERLLLLPWATRCIEDQEAYERETARAPTL
jgi:DnaK suppressor protein